MSVCVRRRPAGCREWGGGRGYIPPHRRLDCSRWLAADQGVPGQTLLAPQEKAGYPSGVAAGSPHRSFQPSGLRGLLEVHVVRDGGDDDEQR